MSSDPKKEVTGSIFVQPYVDPEKHNVGQKKYFGPESTKPNFFNSKIRPPSSGTKAQDEMAPKKTSTKSEPETKRISPEIHRKAETGIHSKKVETEIRLKKTEKETPTRNKPVTQKKTETENNLKNKPDVSKKTQPEIHQKRKASETPRKTVKTAASPSKIPRISDESVKTPKKSLSPTRVKKEEKPVRPKPPEATEPEAPKEEPPAKPEESAKKRPGSSMEKKRDLESPKTKERPPSAHSAHSRPPSRPTGSARSKKESGPEKEKPSSGRESPEAERKRPPSGRESLESERKRPPSGRKSPEADRKRPASGREPSGKQQPEPTVVDTMELFEEVVDPVPTTSKGTRRPSSPKKKLPRPKAPENTTELEIANIEFENYLNLKLSEVEETIDASKSTEVEEKIDASKSTEVEDTIDASKSEEKLPSKGVSFDPGSEENPKRKSSKTDQPPEITSSSPFDLCEKCENFHPKREPEKQRSSNDERAAPPDLRDVLKKLAKERNRDSELSFQNWSRQVGKGSEGIVAYDFQSITSTEKTDGFVSGSAVLNGRALEEVYVQSAENIANSTSDINFPMKLRSGEVISLPDMGRVMEENNLEGSTGKYMIFFSKSETFAQNVKKPEDVKPQIYSRKLESFPISTPETNVIFWHTEFAYKVEILHFRPERLPAVNPEYLEDVKKVLEVDSIASIKPKTSVWQSSKQEIIKEIEESAILPARHSKHSAPTEVAVTFHTSSESANIVATEIKPKKFNPCRRIFRRKKSSTPEEGNTGRVKSTEPDENQTRDSNPEPEKEPKHNFSVRLFGGRKRTKNNEQSTSSDPPENGPTYSVHHCTVEFNSAKSLLIPFLTEPLDVSFSKKEMVTDRKPLLKEGGEDKLIQKIFSEVTESWSYDVKYTIPKTRPETCPAYHSQRNVVQQFVWPDGKTKRLKRKPLKKSKKNRHPQRQLKIQSLNYQSSAYVPKNVFKIRKEGISVNMGFLAVSGSTQHQKILYHKDRSVVLCKVIECPFSTPQTATAAPVEKPTSELTILWSSMPEKIPSGKFTEIKIMWESLVRSEGSHWEFQKSIRVPSWVPLDFPKKTKKKKKPKINQEKSKASTVHEVNKLSVIPNVDFFKGINCQVILNGKSEALVPISHDDMFENEDEKEGKIVMDQPIIIYRMAAPSKAQYENSLLTKREAEFLSLFQEEEFPPKKKQLLVPPIIKSLDSIILNLSEAVKTAIHWDGRVRKNEMDIAKLFTEKSSIMLKVVDYAPDSDLPEKEEKKLTGNPKISRSTLLVQCKEKRQSCEVIKIFPNLLKTYSTVYELPLIKIEFQNFKTESLEIKNEPPYEKVTVENFQREKSSAVLILNRLQCDKRNLIKINDVAENWKLIIDPKEKFYDASECTKGKHSTCFVRREESICDDIIANLKSRDNVKHALTLLDHLMKETENSKKKQPLSTKKIKESLHKLDDVFGLLEGQNQIRSPDSVGKQKKCFSEVLKLLESLTNVVKIQLKEELIREKSSGSTRSVRSSSPENLLREISETFELLANYSEKAKRLIKEFKIKSKSSRA